MTQDVLVVGASSPLGHAVSAELSTRGHHIRRTSRSSAAGFDVLDVTERTESARVLESARPNVVVYLARPDLDQTTGTTTGIRSLTDSLVDFAVICAEHGVDRLIFASSAAVYGTTVAKPHRESDQVHPESPYATLKLRSEEVLAEVGRSHGMSVLALRIFNVYGPGFSKSLVNRIGLGTGTEPPTVRNTDFFVRDYIHSADVARAFAAATEAPDPDSIVMNVGTGIGTSNQVLLSLCADAEYLDPTGAEVRSFSVADISLIQSLWGFEPLVNLEAALRHRDVFLR